MKLFVAGLMLVAAPLSLAAQEPKVTRDIVYTAPTDAGYAPASQHLNVYENAFASASHKAPVLVHVHGGGWDHGTPPESFGAYKAWMSVGFSVVEVEYRFSGVATAPAALQDVRCALSWVVANADKYDLDTQKVVLYGESAGGQLTMMAAYLPPNNTIDPPQCKTQPKIVAELDFFGPYAFEAKWPGAYDHANAIKWLGGKDSPTLAAMAKAMSPITYVRPGIPPTFIVHGDADPTVPYLGSQTLQKALNSVGVKNYLDTVPGGLHGIWPHEQTVRVQADSVAFLKQIGVIK